MSDERLMLEKMDEIGRVMHLAEPVHEAVAQRYEKLLKLRRSVIETKSQNTLKEFFDLSGETVEFANNMLDSKFEGLLSNPDAAELFDDNTSLGSLSDDEEPKLNVNAEEWKPTPKATLNVKNEPKNKSATKTNQPKPKVVESKKVKSGPKRNSKSKKKWWHSLNDSDPITMEALSELKYPPFSVPVDGQYPHYFDGQSLAQYLVSTANFINPNNRQLLKRDTCVKLDSYLKNNQLTNYQVTNSFDLSKNVRVENPDHRRDAAVIARNMFSSDRFGSSRLTNRQVFQEDNLRVVDVNEWNEVHISTLEDESEFPAMPTSQFPTQPAASQPSWVMRAQTEANPVAERPRIVSSSLAARLRDSLAQGDAGARSSCIFGAGKPREEGVSSHVRPPPMIDNKGFLCPYQPSFLSDFRKMGVSFVSRVERDLIEFCNSAATIRTKSLPVMNIKQRSLVHCLAQNYYGLESRSVDPEGSRHLVLSKLPGYSIPECSVLDSLLLFEHLLDDDDAYAASKFEDKANFSILLLEAQEKVTSSMIDSVMEEFTRSSCYFARHIDAESIIVEFHDKNVARKVYSKMTEYHGAFWKLLQWWPASERWASYQIHRNKSAARLDRDQKREQRKHENKVLKPRVMLVSGTGWDEPTDSKLPVTKKPPVKKINKERSSIWATLMSESSDDEEM